MDPIRTTPGWFDGFRMKPFPTQYGELKTPVTVDVLEVGWIVAFFTVLAAFLCILPAMKTSHWQRFLVFVRVSLFLFLGLVIMLCNFGQEWEVGQVDTLTPYRAGTGQEINARVGVKIGLRSVNVTLKGERNPEGDLLGETIDYNERYSWAWGQGRFGFGPFAGAIQRNFRAAQRRGTPLPILWVAEIFTFDGEGLRFGRYYRTSGWFAHICIWTALPLWILTAVLSKLVISYAAITLALTGVMLFVASLIWALNRNFLEFEVLFTPPEGVLRTQFGVHWYLALIVGVLCMAVGLLLYLLDDVFHDQLSKFFGNNPHQILEEETTEVTEVKQPTSEMEMEDMNSAPQQPRIVTTYRGRGTTKRHKKKLTYSVYADTATLVYPAFNPNAGYSAAAPPHMVPVSQLAQKTQGYPDNFQNEGYPRVYAQDQPQGYPQGQPQGYPQGQPQGYPQGQPQGYPQGQPKYHQGGYQDSSYMNQGYSEDLSAKDEEIDTEEPLYANTMAMIHPEKPRLPPKGRKF
ncbi:dual oxidase maturation factor 1-like [Panulirus ornatus]|uniref:dual oxidase maturation factor 1-like n=1 Tax=Panulirus ornatus TaxID=150431 RepID=UPI003A844CD3